MIDLRKPLEGAPGLLLMAALILFGAAIGIGVAIVFKWIEMGDALANFLGGVVGAGLGAVLAIGGAVYVQRKEARDRMTAPLNLLISRVEFLGNKLIIILREVLDENMTDLVAPNSQISMITRYLGLIEADLSTVPDGEYLPRDVHTDVYHLKQMFPFSIRQAREALQAMESARATGTEREAIRNACEYMLGRVNAVHAKLVAL